MDMHDANLERFNKTGLKDAYNVMKHLEEQKDKPLNARKGGKSMDEERKDVPQQETEGTAGCQPDVKVTQPAPTPVDDDPDLAEAEEGDSIVE